MSTINNLPTDKIAIIMATYNGERYIAAQIESLLQQTHTNWLLTIRDDGSTDNTVNILKSFALRDSRINVLNDNDGNLGFNRNFYRLLAVTQASYISICDQDDVWLPEKLALSLQALKSLETPQQNPALVHCDANVVNEHLTIIHHRLIGKRGTRLGLAGLLFANSVQGAAILMNASLKTIALQTTPNIPYDYHLGLLAELVGARAFIAKPLLKYRQHANNIIGVNKDARPQSANNHVKKISSGLLTSLALYPIFQSNYAMMATKPECKAQLNDYLTLFESKHRLLKLYILFKNRYTFYRSKDWLEMVILLLLNKNIKPQTPHKAD